MLTILVFEIKEEKIHTKSKKNINYNLSLLIRGGGGGVAMSEGHVCGGILSQKVFKFEARKCHFLHSEHPNLL
jgi:hypothetical protein